MEILKRSLRWQSGIALEGVRRGAFPPSRSRDVVPGGEDPPPEKRSVPYRFNAVWEEARGEIKGSVRWKSLEVETLVREGRLRGWRERREEESAQEVGVASPDVQGQEGGEGDPGQVRDEQGRRQGTQTPEQDQCGEDEHPEEEDLYEREGPQPPREEQPGPKGVESQLNEEEPEGRPRVPEAVLPPDQPSGDAHHEVENRPDRPEEVGRRGPGGAKELTVELPGLGGGDGAHRRGGKDGKDPPEETEKRLVPEGFLHHRPTSLQGIQRPFERGRVPPPPGAHSRVAKSIQEQMITYNIFRTFGKRRGVVPQA